MLNSHPMHRDDWECGYHTSTCTRVLSLMHVMIKQITNSPFVHECSIEWITIMNAVSHSSLFLVHGKQSQEQHPQHEHSFFTGSLQQEDSTEQVVDIDASV